MIRKVIALLVVLAAGPLGRVARAQQAASRMPIDSTRKAVVTYISGQSIYLSAGRLDGVREGLLLEVFRGAGVVAYARATFLASHSSSAEVVPGTGVPVVGDSVRYVPAKDNAVVAAATESAPVRGRPAAPAAYWRRHIRGHVGLRYMTVSQPGLPDRAGWLQQPSGDVRIEGTSLAGGLLGFVIDSRSRGTIGSREMLASPLDKSTLIYQAALSVTHQQSGARLSIGRQYSPALGSIGLFDGATAELNRARWGAGLFNAMQPDVATMQLSSNIREAGGYVQVHSRPGGASPWSVTMGGIGSRDSGQLNRQFGFTQVTLSSRLLSLYATQEIDFNSGWKRTAGEPAVTPTSTFASVSVRPLEELSIQAGADNRRNVLLYRDYVNPVTAFDDAFRQGVWGGASYSLPRRLRAGLDARLSQGGAAGKAEQFTGSLGIGPVLAQRLDVRLRSTSYRTERTTGWMHAVTAGADPIDLLHVEVNSGVRTQRVRDAAGAGTPFTTLNALSDGGWFGASVDLNVGRSWYVLVSGTRDNVGLDPTNLLYCSLIFRF